MKTPVLIPVRNEAPYLAATLESLPADLTEPHVLVNGTTDGSADIGRSFGAQVTELPEPGKLPAIQHALRHMGRRALEPLIMLDGDTRPLFPRRWHDAMLGQLTAGADGSPRSVSGPVWFQDAPIHESSARLLLFAAKVAKARTGGRDVHAALYGANFGLHLRHDHVLEPILDLPHYWPGEDAAMAHVIIGRGGSHHPSLRPDLLAVTPFAGRAGVAEYLRHGIRQARVRATAVRTETAPPGSRPFAG